MGFLDAIAEERQRLLDAPNDSVNGPKPCGKCGSPIFYSYTSYGTPLACPECDPPNRPPKSWRHVIMIDGKSELAECKSQKKNAGRSSGKGEAADDDMATDDDDMATDGNPVFEIDWDSSAEYADRFFASRAAIKKSGY